MKSVLIFMLLGFSAWSQTLLRNTQVWQYDQNTIYLDHRTAGGSYVREEYCYDYDSTRPPGGGPIRPEPNRCYKNEEYRLLPDTKLESQTYTLASDEYKDFSIPLSQFYTIQKVQVRVLSGSVKIHSVVTTNKDQIPKQINITSRQSLCEMSAETFNINEDLLSSLSLSLKNESRKQALVEVNIQHSPARCGGCNVHGCFLAGGGCNVYGCFGPGNGCNVYGCFVRGGGCNVYGCWYAGGSCNVRGCVKEAPKDAGRADKKPVCE